MLKYDVIILGAGAAGLMCAVHAGGRGRRVLVIEHADRIGKKILISGGGRCNFTNLYTRPESFLSSNPHFCKSALARYSPRDFLDLVTKHGISFHEKKDGQLFCDHRAAQITAMLETEVRKSGAEIRTGTRVMDVQKGENFVLQTSDGEFTCESLVIATGGLSIPKIGATSFGYDLARQFGLNIIEPRPGLVPLIMDEDFSQKYADLTGVSIRAKVTCQSMSFTDAVLFTHRGLSGPAILQISSYWVSGCDLILDLGAELDLSAPRSEDTRLLSTFMGLSYPKRFVQAFCRHEVNNQPLNRYTEADWKIVRQKLCAWKVKPIGTEGFEKAEVTLGGVDTKELSSKTMESIKVPGLYFIGEVVDVTGHLGGYNFQWAWASGVAAGHAV